MATRVMSVARRLSPERQLAKDDLEWRMPAKADLMARAVPAMAIVGSAMMLAAESAAMMSEMERGALY